MIVAGVGISTCAAILMTLRSDTSYSVLVVAYLAFGIGFGMLNAPITNSAVSGMPRAQAGVAAAIASTSRQVGTSLGLAVLGGCGLGVLTMAWLTTSGWALRTRDLVGAETG